MLHQEKYSDLRDFFSDDGGDCGDKRVARSLGRWRVVLASKSPEATSEQTTHYSSSLHSWGEVEHDGVLSAHEDHGVSPYVPHQCSRRHGLASIVSVIHWDHSGDHSGAPNDHLGDGVGFERCYGRHPVVIVTQCNESLHQYIMGPHYITITLVVVSIHLSRAYGRIPRPD